RLGCAWVAVGLGLREGASGAMATNGPGKKRSPLSRRKRASVTPCWGRESAQTHPRLVGREQSMLSEPVAGVGSEVTYQVARGTVRCGTGSTGAVCAEIIPSDGLRLPTR